MVTLQVVQGFWLVPAKGRKEQDKVKHNSRKQANFVPGSLSTA